MDPEASPYISEDIVKLAKKIKTHRISKKELEELKIKNESLKNQIKGLKDNIKVLKLNTLEKNRLLGQIRDLEEDNRKLISDSEIVANSQKFIVTTPQESSVHNEISNELSKAQQEILICSPWITYILDELSNLKKVSKSERIKIKIITHITH